MNLGRLLHLILHGLPNRTQVEQKGKTSSLRNISETSTGGSRAVMSDQDDSAGVINEGVSSRRGLLQRVLTRAGLVF